MFQVRLAMMVQILGSRNLLPLKNLEFQGQLTSLSQQGQRTSLSQALQSTLLPRLMRQSMKLVRMILDRTAEASSCRKMCA